MLDLAREIDRRVFDQLAPLAPSTGVMALAVRPSVDTAAVLADARAAPVVLLEDPRDLGNMGACVRVAAAADAAGVLSTGTHDPWHPDALRGAAGLHFAVPVARACVAEDLQRLDRPLLAIDPDGEPLEPSALPARALLAFGTERHGLSRELLARADAHVGIPMRAGVSSLNLATSVAAVLYAWRLSAGPLAFPRGEADERAPAAPRQPVPVSASPTPVRPRRAAASCRAAPPRHARASCRPARRRPRRSSSARTISSRASPACSTSRSSCTLKYSVAGPSPLKP